jgi:hypothetical protein
MMRIALILNLLLPRPSGYVWRHAAEVEEGSRERYLTDRPNVWCLKFKEFSLRPLRISAFSALKAA